jgi:hypothetical protein
VRTPFALFAYAVLVRIVLVILYPDPAYPDSFYYVDVARALHAGQGFNIDFIWTFVDTGGVLPANAHFPIPSNAHWTPFASLIQLPLMAVLGTSPMVGMIPFILIGATAAPLAWAIARDAGARPMVALAAGLLTAVPAASTVFMGQPDNFSIYQPFGAAALWLGARALKGDRRAFPLAGLMVGLAALARNDGILLGLALAIVFAWDRWRAWRSGGGRQPAISFAGAMGCAGLFLVCVGPWWLRQLAVFGNISPSSASGRILWIRQIGDMNSLTAPASLSSFLAQGPGPILESRLLGFVAAVGNYSIIVCSFVLTPFLVIGGWLRRRSIDFGPFFVYAAILFGAATVLFAVHVPSGTFLHSAVSLVPHSYVLVIEGVVGSVLWAARRRPRWNAEEAQRVFIGATVGIAILTGALGVWKVQEEWGRERHLRQLVAAELDRMHVGPDEYLMSADASGFKYFTGRGGVVTVNDPLATVEAVGRAYHIRWLVLERRSIVDRLGDVLKGTGHLPWIGPPAFAVDESPPENADDTYPDIAVYPTCFEPSDTRCGTGTTVLAP